MEEIGKRRLAAAGAVAAGIVYFLVCAIPLRKELVLVPAWSRSLSEAPAAPSSKASGNGSRPIPFRLGGRFGYYTAEGSLLFAAPVDYGVALAPDAYATYDRLSEGFVVKSPFGTDLAKVSVAGYPFFAAGRRFVVGPDQATVTELAGDGSPLWSYQFRSIVTAFDACPSMALFGLADGSLVGLDRAGAAALDFAPGGSRVAGVYGVAVSPDGRLAAAITGADKQRLVVLEKRSSAYRVGYHRYLASDYRRPVFIAFTADGKKIAYESPSGVGIYEPGERAETVVSVPPAARPGATLRGGEIMAFLSESGGEKRLVCAAMPDRRILDARFGASLAFVEVSGDAVFLGLDDAIVRMDLEEL